MRQESVPIDLLDAHPANRTTLERIDELAASISELGVLDDILVRVHPLDSTRYQIESGHRRVAAARKAGLTEIPAKIAEHDDDTAFLALLAAETQHDPWTAADRDRGMQGVLSLGDVERTARATGVDAGKLKRAQRGRELVDKKKLQTASFDDLATLAEFEGTPEFLELEKYLGTGQFAYRASEARRRRENVEKTKAEIAELEAAGAVAGEFSYETCYRLDDLRTKTDKPVKREDALKAAVLFFRDDQTRVLLFVMRDEAEELGWCYAYGRHETAEARAEREERERAWAQTEEHLMTAQMVRHEFLRTYVLRGKNPIPEGLASAIGSALLEASYVELRPERARKILWDQENPSPAHVIAATLVDFLDAMVFDDINDCDPDIEAVYPDTTRAYFEELKSLGYTLSPVESELYDSASRAQRKAAAQDDEPASEADLGEPEDDLPSPVPDIAAGAISAQWLRELPLSVDQLRETSTTHMTFMRALVYDASYRDGKLIVLADVHRPADLALADITALAEALGCGEVTCSGALEVEGGFAAYEAVAQ